MSLSNEERKIMVQVELERAERMTTEFAVYIENQYWNTLVNRLYYAAFHAVTALLIHNGLHASTHQGVYALLSRHFVKDGIMSQDEGRLFSRLATMREKGDYNCYLDATEEDILPLIEPTKALINHCKQLVAQ